MRFFLYQKTLKMFEGGSEGRGYTDCRNPQTRSDFEHLNQSLSLAAGIYITLLFLFGTITLNAGAQENHGPHAGYVRAGTADPKHPGTAVKMNAELLVRNDSEITIYIIDESWGEVDLKDTSVLVSYIPHKGAKSALSCKENLRALNCQLPKGSKLADGDKIVISRRRNGEAGITFDYTYPFKYEA